MPGQQARQAPLSQIDLCDILVPIRICENCFCQQRAADQPVPIFFFLKERRKKNTLIFLLSFMEYQPEQQKASDAVILNRGSTQNMQNYQQAAFEQYHFQDSVLTSQSAVAFHVRLVGANQSLAHVVQFANTASHNKFHFSTTSDCFF